MDRYQESFATDSAPFVEARNEYPITQESVKFNTAASGSCCYTSAGSFTFTVPAGVYNFDVTVVGGGGGGVYGCVFSSANVYSCTVVNHGGAGQTIINKVSSIPGCVFGVTVGNGGIGLNSSITLPASGACCASCGGSSCFCCNSYFMIKASGGLGIFASCSLDSCMMCGFIATHDNYIKRLNNCGWETSVGGAIQRVFSSPSCETYPPVSPFCRDGRLHGFPSAIGMPAYSTNTSTGSNRAHIPPTLGSGGGVHFPDGYTGSPNANGADGAVIITWLKGQ